jgi:hypothetical protein
VTVLNYEADEEAGGKLIIVCAEGRITVRSAAGIPLALNGRPVSQASVVEGDELAVGSMTYTVCGAAPPRRGMPQRAGELWDGEQRLVLADPIALIGNDAQADIALAATAAAIQVAIVRVESEHVLIDLTGSGTSVDGKEVRQVVLKSGQGIEWGDHRFIFHSGAAAAFQSDPDRMLAPEALSLRCFNISPMARTLLAEEHVVPGRRAGQFGRSPSGATVAWLNAICVINITLGAIAWRLWFGRFA